MKTPLWIDIPLHLLFTTTYALYYAKKHGWKKRYFAGSLLIVAFGMLIDLDHRRIIEKVLKKLSGDKISLNLPKHIVHICHTWQFAIGLLIASLILFLSGPKDLAILIYASYFTHMLIDSLGKSGLNPSNLFPAKIHHFIARLFP
ncbi:hypothetical protein L6259_03940 [Candidatus Parcubacteria bacterium]|nr:metal-dependent hydrolase [Patescibacteria group bacterium]MCG2694388.1 hypothetical protein [Candidatus Parcubacteria bacterium]